MRYEDAAAFRAALAANLRNQHPDKDLNRLLKRTVMERFLARTSTALPQQAILKGGYALELRLHQARATQDLDLSIRGVPDHEVADALRDAGEIDLGDHLSFRIETTTARMPQGAPLGGERLTVVPLLGGKRFQPFPLDVGLGDVVPDRTDLLKGGIDLSFAGLPALETPAIPLEVHLAEKLHALSLPRPAGRLNTRVKDLVDVMLLQRRGLPPKNALRDAAEATFARRATHALPTAIDVPTEAWELEYQRFATALDLTSYAPTVHDAAVSLNRLVEALREDGA
ncbi:MAG: nucleotidyl transferase AbiEii/AbiGii toxin family protein [Trueperaceae bacterium]